MSLDPKSTRRNSLFAIFRWFRARDGSAASLSGSSGSLDSTHSVGTVASFSFVPAGTYEKSLEEKKSVALGPETDTYRARLKQRDKRRENDKNLTLRKKYNLFFQREEKAVAEEEEENTRSLPSTFTTRPSAMQVDEEVKVHRRTNSESSKIRKAGAYLHVKGKRRAPPPPRAVVDGDSTARRKRLAPAPPPVSVPVETEKDVIFNDTLKLDHGVLKPVKNLEGSSKTNQSDQGVLRRGENLDGSSAVASQDHEDSRIGKNFDGSKSKTDQVILKSGRNLNGSSAIVQQNHEVLRLGKNFDGSKSKTDQVISKPGKHFDGNSATPQTSNLKPSSPRPWYKRNTSKESNSSHLKKEKADHKYEPVEIAFARGSTLDITLGDATKTDKKKEEKRKSGLSFLTNISELDREAGEIMKSKEYERNGFEQEMPEFMRLKETKTNADWASPKRRSARDLIAKFNAITNVTKVTVNTALFGASQKDSKLFGKQTSLDETKRRQESLLESHRKRLDEIDRKNAPLMKSESASSIKPKPGTPKIERKSWKCPKCNLVNEYWRIICHVCSAIKPYFDDFSTPVNKPDVKTSSPLMMQKDKSPPKRAEMNLNLERSRTQIGFSALASYNSGNKIKTEKIVSEGVQAEQNLEANGKKEEREKLKKMLIEMKNSLPKRKSHMLQKQGRTSVIVENPETPETENRSLPPKSNGNEKQRVDEKQAKDQQIVKPEAIKTETKNITTPEILKLEVVKKENAVTEKTQEERVAEILIGTSKTIYENIKVKKNDFPKANKVSASNRTCNAPDKKVQQSKIKNPSNEKPAGLNQADQLKESTKTEPKKDNTKAKLLTSTVSNLVKEESNKNKNNYELMRVKDFEDIYSDANSKSPARIYANLARNDELSLFFNMPKNIGGENSKDRARSANKNDTIEINRLLRRLESSIAKGELTEAAIFAKELAQLKVNCSVVRQKQAPGCGADDTKKGFRIDMYVEDKVSHRGPFPVEVTANQTLGQLKRQIEKEFEIPIDCQQWILGKKLVTNDESTLKDNEISAEGCPVFLYLVAPEKKKLKCEEIKSSKDENRTAKASTSKANDDEKVAQEEIITKPIPVEVREKEDKLEQVRMNVQELQNRLNKSRLEAKTFQDHMPKIVNVIPKVVESQPRSVVRIVPVQIELKVDDVAPLESLEKAKNDKKILETNVERVEIESASGNKENIISTTNIDIKISVQPQLQKTPKETEAKEKVTGTTDHKPSTSSPSTSSSVTAAPKAKQENFEEYDSSTLKPAKEWACHLCTLLNPMTSNICSICSTVKLSKTNSIAPKKSTKIKKAPQPKRLTDETYRQLVNLDNKDLVENLEPFECVVCFTETAPFEGVTLRECLHQFCKPCLANTVEFADEAEVKCPYMDDDYSCDIALQDREIKALVSAEVYEQHLAKSVAQAENRMDKSFHCKTPDCKGWCVFEDNVNEFRCPVCRKTNCLTCQTIHAGLNCKQYQEKMNQESEIDDDARRTKEMLEEMVNKGEAIECPACRVILMKKWGCDWLRCSMCKTEVCWVTRGPRWGPGGKGDTSGGCRCGANGVKCHPKCNYCH